MNATCLADNYPLTVTIPWPSRTLSPNARSHWAKLAKAKKAYRAECHHLAVAQGVTPIQADALHLVITFHPPSRRRYDLDNALASIKAGLDGIADAVQVDDSLWTLTIQRGEPGRGVVTVRVLTGHAPQYIVEDWQGKAKHGSGTRRGTHEFHR